VDHDVASAEILRPLLRRFNPIGRRLLGTWELRSVRAAERFVCAGGRRVPLRPLRRLPGGPSTATNMTEAIVVLAVDLGLPLVHSYRNARRDREALTAAAATLLALGLVDPAEDDADAATGTDPGPRGRPAGRVP